MTGPLRKSATGAVHTLLRDSYSEPYFTSWCESPRNKCSRHSRVSATPFPRRGWWTRSSRRPRLPPYGPSRVQKPAPQKRPAALRRLSYVRKKRAVPRVLPPHTPRPDSATSSSAAPREPPGGAADSGADPGRRTHRPHSRPQRTGSHTHPPEAAPRRAAPPLPPPAPFLPAPSAARRTQAQRDPHAGADTRVGVLSRGGGGVRGTGGPPGRGAGVDGGAGGAAGSTLPFPGATWRRRPRCLSPLLPSREA